MPSTTTLRASGANSASFKTTGSTSCVINATHWDLLSDSRLKTFLTTEYDSAEEFLNAFGDEGGLVALSSDGASSAAVWSLSSNLPVLTVAQAANGNFTSVRIALSYSASA